MAVETSEGMARICAWRRTKTNTLLCGTDGLVVDDELGGKGDQVEVWDQVRLGAREERGEKKWYILCQTESGYVRSYAST